MQRLCSVLASSVLAAGPAFAGDGLVEINQTCVQAIGGCFSGDAQGLPVTIDGSAGRSYALTSDLTLATGDVTGIVVSAADVSIDLRGFTIRGANQCSDGGGCTFTGSGHGIQIAADRVQVANGSVVGAGSVGIVASSGNGHVIRNVRVAHNRFQGIAIAGLGSAVEGVTAALNGDVGVASGAGSRVVGSSAFDNGLHGIQAAAGSSVSKSVAYSNGLDGIFIDNDGEVAECSARENGRHGINIGVASAGVGRGTVRDSVSTRNGQAGVAAIGGVLVADCSLSDNQVGLGAAFPTAYRGNLITQNSGPPVSGSPINLGNNACTDSTNMVLPCP